MPEPRESALLAGETGILLVAFRLTSGSDLAETLHTRVRENVDNEADEIMWGSPGTLDRGAAHARVDRRSAVARGVGRERGCVAHASRFRRAMDAAAPRACDALSRPRPRSRRKRAGARAAARLEASVSPRAPHGRDPRTRRVRGGRSRELAARRARAPGEHAWRDPVAVVPRGSGDCVFRRALSRRGAPAGGRRADVAGGRSRRQSGRVDLPRDGRQRLRAPEGVRADGRRALARARPPLRGSCARADAPAT